MRPIDEEVRIRAILGAARDSFLAFGFAKTSVDDIAKRAKLSRTLLYRHFSSKEAIFAAVFEATFEERYPRVEALLATRASAREKLLGTYEILLLEPWDTMIAAPMAADFYETCVRLFPEVEGRHTKRLRKYVRTMIADADVAETFMLAVDGLQADLPKTPVLRRRLKLLVERFV